MLIRKIRSFIRLIRPRVAMRAENRKKSRKPLLRYITLQVVSLISLLAGEHQKTITSLSKTRTPLT